MTETPGNDPPLKKMHPRRLHEEEGLPLRDVGIALGISYQRTHQLVDEARELADA